MWTKLDDSSNESGKLDSISDAAFRLWAMALVWSRKNENLWLQGRIPLPLLPTISRNKWPAKRLAALAQELVKVTAGGRSGHGLWEVAEDGWQIHDWQQYGPAGPNDALTPSDVARLGGLASARARKAKAGTAIPQGAKNRATRATSSEPVRLHIVEPVREPVLELVRAQASEPTEPPDPDPDLNKSPLPLTEPVRSVQRGKEGVRKSADDIDRALESMPVGTFR